MFGQLRYLRQNGPQDAPPISFPQEDGVDKTGVRLDEFLETLILVDDVYYALRDVVFGPSTDNSENVLSRSLKDRIIVERVLKHHDELLDPECIVGWSRYGNFWARHVGCGHLPPDYYTHYGYYYCSRYAAYLLPRLSPKGKQWMAQARSNLQVYLDEAIQKNMIPGSTDIIISQNNDDITIGIMAYELELESEIFRDVAFATHVDAYIDAGLADLPLSDLMKIGTMPNVEEFLDPNTWDQVIKVSEEVLPELIERGGENLSTTWDRARESANELMDKAIERLTSWY
ncbi:MAG: hypothetical protein GYB17_04590 [Gammaproteobacteria bacterium]|nr:hypothetical protein [Halomonas sp. BN3-1]MBR9878776.1 hypothetical protein [Gammaproteobacteria bacterium]